MIATMEEMKAEAVKRMRTLKIHPGAIREFEIDGILNCSVSSLGVLDLLRSSYKPYVKAFESKHGGVVYHAIISNTRNFRLLSMLYVSQHKDEWADDNAMIEGKSLTDMYQYSYVENLEDRYLSEFGLICIRRGSGGLVRVF